MQKKRDDGIPVREACVKKWFLVMKLICVYIVSVVESFCEWFHSKESKSGF